MSVSNGRNVDVLSYYCTYFNWSCPDVFYLITQGKVQSKHTYN
jgi:uncharacterized protein YuzB (UPF0349 family)